MRMIKYLSYLISCLLLLSIVHALTIPQLVESYSYDFYNGSINITTYTNGMLDTNADNLNDTIQFNLTVVPFITGQYKTYLSILDSNGIVTINDTRIYTTTTSIDLNVSTTKLNDSKWNYSVEIYDANDILVFRKYRKETSQYGAYKNGTSIKSITDANLNNNFINITLTFNVSTNETVNITGFLFANTTNTTISATTEQSLIIGEQTVFLLFDNESIKATHHNGTFNLDTVTIGSKIINTDYNTSNYSYETFAKTSYIKSLRSGYVDNQSNNLSDYLQVNSTVNIKSAGNYTLEGALYDEADNFIINFSEPYFSLSTGEQTLSLLINGSKIYQTYTDGPYVLNYINLLNGTSDVIDSLTKAHTTNTTFYSSFERPKLPDLNITLNVTFSSATNITNISINVSNKGTAPAANIILDIFDNNTYAKNDSVAFLEIGQIKEFNFSVENSTNLTVYIAIVDFNNIVDELNESNNIDVWPPINPPPIFENSTYTPTNPKFNDVVSFNITIKDDLNGSYYIFSYNNGSGFINNSPVLWNGTNNITVQINKTLTGKAGTVVQWLWYANDTENAMAESDVSSFTIVSIAPTIETPIFNVSNVTKATGIKANTTYRDADSDNGNISFTWRRNGSVIFTENLTNITSTTIVNSSLTSTLYNRNDVLNVTVFANDGLLNSSINYSITVTVGNSLPVQTAIFNSTYALNRTDENLTVYNISTADADGDAVKNIISWYRNNTPIAILNLPFEGGSNATNTTDYSGRNRAITINGTSITWNATAGYDGKGAYDFDGSSTPDMMRHASLPREMPNGWSAFAWIKPRALNNRFQMIAGNCDQTNGYFLIWSNNRLTVSYVNSTNNQKTIASSVLPSANIWYHVGFTIHPNSTVNIYINGSIDNSQTLNQGIGTTIQSEIYHIGNSQTQCGQPYWLKFNGTIDEFVFYNTSLTPSQVLALYNNRTNVIDSSMTEVNDVWNASITPNDNIENGATLTSSGLTILPNTAPTIDVPVFNVTNVTKATGIKTNTTYKDPDGHNGTVYFTWYRNSTLIYTENITSVANNTIVNSTLPVSFYNRSDLLNVTVYSSDGSLNSPIQNTSTLTVFNALPSQSTPLLNSTSGRNLTTDNLTLYNISTADADGDAVKNIISWYRNNTPIAILNLPFEGGSNATNTKDYSGFNRIMAINGTSIVWNSSAGIDGKGAYDFDGSSTSDMMRTTSVPTTMANGWSVAAWIKPRALNNRFQMIGGNCDQINFYFIVWNNNKLVGSYANATGQQKTLTSALLPSTNTWYHVAYTVHPNSTVNIYINGSINVSQTLNQGINPAIQYPIFHVGNSQTQCGQPYWLKFNGTIDEFAYYNFSLTPDQVSALYNNRTDVIDSSMTELGETWNASITPNDNQINGTTLFSNSLLIRQEPTLELIFGYGGETMNSTTYNVTQTLVDQPVEKMNSTNYNVTLGWTVYG